MRMHLIVLWILVNWYPRRIHILHLRMHLLLRYLTLRHLGRRVHPVALRRRIHIRNLCRHVRVRHRLSLWQFQTIFLVRIFNPFLYRCKTCRLVDLNNHGDLQFLVLKCSRVDLLHRIFRVLLICVFYNDDSFRFEIVSNMDNITNTHNKLVQLLYDLLIVDSCDFYLATLDYFVLGD